MNSGMINHRIELSRYKPAFFADLESNSSQRGTNRSEHALKWLHTEYPKQIHFSIEEVAAITGMSRDFVRDHIESGAIQHIRMGRYFRITQLELARVLSEGV